MVRLMRDIAYALRISCNDDGTTLFILAAG